MKKFLALLLACLMLMSLAACGQKAEPAAVPPDVTPFETVTPQPAALKSDLIVLFTSDVHCGVNSGFGYVGLAQLRDTLKSEGYHVVLADNGDSIQGEPVGTMTTGEANILMMNAVGYDVATIGNHEFDYGMERFLELAGKADFPYVSANFNKEGELVFPAYVIKEFDGVKVAFVGVTTPKTITSSTPKYFQNEAGEFIYGFRQGGNGEEFYASVQTAVDEARAEGATYVVCLAHLGSEAECAPYTYADLIANTTGIDAVLDGHSHDTDPVEMLNKDGVKVLRQACGTKLEAVGYLKITVDGRLSVGLYKHDSTVSDAVADSTDALNEILAEEVAETDVALITHDPVAVDEDGDPIRIIRTSETNLGDLCADAYRFVSGADIAFVNGGGIRSQLKAGRITRNDLLLIHPYSNNLCVVEANGQEILDALELSVHALPEQYGGFLQVSGLSFEVHTYIPSSVVLDDNGMFVKVDGEYRVKNVMVGGEPLDLTKTYTLACHDYKLKNMGDGYTMFADNVFLLDSVMVDNQVLITYITEHLGGVVGDEYAEPYGQGRIVAVTEPPAEEAPEDINVPTVTDGEEAVEESAPAEDDASNEKETPANDPAQPKIAPEMIPAA